MATVQMTGRVRARLALGKSILSIADKTPGVEVIQPSVDAFRAVQEEYGDAGRKVRALRSRLGETRMGLGELDVDMNLAVEVAARALVNEGGTRNNPFRVLGVAAPSAIMKLRVAEKITAVAELTAALQRHQGDSQAVLAAAEAGDQAAAAAQLGLANIEKQKAAVQIARDVRAAIGQRWATQFAALKRAAQFAKDNGAPHIFSALFERARPSRTRGRSGKGTPAEASTSRSGARASGSSPTTVPPTS